MELSTLLYFVALLACPISMGAMMWMMSRNMHSQNEQAAPGAQMPSNASERLAGLRHQQQALETDMAEMTRLVELEAQRDALLKKREQEHEPGTAALADSQTAS